MIVARAQDECRCRCNFTLAYFYPVNVLIRETNIVMQCKILHNKEFLSEAKRIELEIFRYEVCDFLRQKHILETEQ